MKLWLTILIVLITGKLLYAQEYPQKDIDLEVLTDEIFGFQDLDLNYQELYENMAQLLANKVNLNTANAEELRFLNLLTEQQVQVWLPIARITECSYRCMNYNRFQDLISRPSIR